MKSHPRIALFGGSFDPIHQGHLLIAEQAVRSLELDEVRFIPCRISPHKLDHPPASSEARLDMLRLATAGRAWATVDESELLESPPSYSYKTAARIHAENPAARLFWLLGTDQWESLPSWKQPQRLAELLEFIVFRRGKAPQPRSGWRMTSIEGNHPASSSAIREAIQNNQPTHNWLHPEVARYIEEHDLFRA